MVSSAIARLPIRTKRRWPLAVTLGFWSKTLYKLLNKIHLGFKLPEMNVLYGWEAPDGSPTPIGDRLNHRALSFAVDGPKVLPPKPPKPADQCGPFDPHAQCR
ncbi:MAG TPA: hypothetical protein VGL99_11295 [Chloroflexota bacterium]